jgi:glycosyltransferase involved in cell wall biosynthesis
MKTAFIMPAFNEELLLRVTVEGALEVTDKVVVINDGSRDRTGEVAAALASEHPGRVIVVTHPKNLGLGRAVVNGLRRALEEKDVDAVGIMAADNQCDPSLIPLFRAILEQMPDIDVAKGSRFLHQESLHNMPRFRYWGNRFVSSLMELILGYWNMSDILHGYLLARREKFEQMDLSLISDGYDLENTMMAEFRRMGTRFALIPSPSRYGDETSTIDVKKQIPKTLGKMGRLLQARLTTGPLRERVGPLLVALAVPTGGATLALAVLHMRRTSPRVEVLSPDQIHSASSRGMVEEGGAAATGF